MTRTDYTQCRNALLLPIPSIILKSLLVITLLISSLSAWGIDNGTAAYNGGDNSCGTCDEYCSFTIGYWGTHRVPKGNNGGPTTEDLIPDGIKIEAECNGNPQMISLSLNCVHQILPPQPRACYLPSNSLVRQYIGLYLNTLHDPDLASLPLANIRCINLNSVSGTVADLLQRAANAIVCGGISSSLIDDLTAVNERFDECEKNTNCDGSCPSVCEERPCYTLECINGECVYTPLDCADDNPCTEDYCDPNTGQCVNQPIDCDDGDPCTDDYCNAWGECVNTPKDCDDGDPCTVDYCDDWGNCVNTPKDCDDGNPCTDDYCDQWGNCVNTPIPGCGDPCYGKNCDDGDPCTNDYCLDGVCHNVPIDCDDGDPCTEDYCDAWGNCVNKPIPGCGDPCEGVVCDDGDECTRDICVNGECKFIPIPDCQECPECPECPEPCDKTVADCNDGNPWTTDVLTIDCECLHFKEPIPCEKTIADCYDGDPKTVDVLTIDCECLNIKQEPCDDPCEGIVCPDDGDPCTIEKCVDGECLTMNAPACTLTYSKDCDDGKDCTINDKEIRDQCSNEICVPCQGTPVTPCENSWKEPCDDGNNCTIDDYKYVDACGNVCVPCKGTPVTPCENSWKEPCDDGDDCTTDDYKFIDACGNICLPCAGTPVSDCSETKKVYCNDGDDCTTDDYKLVSACDETYVCQPCKGTPVDNCEKTIKVYCNDGDDCTTDDYKLVSACDETYVCQPCKGTPVDNCEKTIKVYCNDGDDCTTDDYKLVSACDETFECQPCRGVPDDKCEETKKVYCTDGDPCTIDGYMLISVCDPSYVCQTCPDPIPDPACNEYCTYTIGYWGTHPEVTDPIIEAAGGSIDITNSDCSISLSVNCVHTILPPQPKACGTVESYSLLRQYIGVWLAIQADFAGTDLASLKLADIKCYNFNSSAETVGDLLAEAAELLACGKDDSSLNEDLTAINELFDECEELKDCNGSNLSSESSGDKIKESSKAYNHKVRPVPNPVNNSLNILYDLRTDNTVEITLVDFLGNQIQKVIHQGTKGENTITVDVEQYNAGMYLIMLREVNKDRPRIAKFVKIED